jgi:predicted NUDIX family NTP pyrophosphohydrolase
MNGGLNLPRHSGRRGAAGILLYREADEGLEVLLVHPSGWYNKKASWSLPKGLLKDGESLEQAAIRETLEETGVAVGAPLAPLGFVTYRWGKRVHAFCAPRPEGAAPCCASWEVDRAEFVPIGRAWLRLHGAQREFLERLEQHLGISREAARRPVSAFNRARRRASRDPLQRPVRSP